MRRLVVITVENFMQDFSMGIRILQEKGFDADWRPLPIACSDSKRLIDTVKGSVAVIAGGESWTGEVFAATKPTLKVVARFGAGFDRVDLKAAGESGVRVVNSPVSIAKAVAEETLGLILALLRKIARYDREIRHGVWSPSVAPMLYGKTIGIIGFGEIGRSLARLLEPFNNDILVHDTKPDAYAEKAYKVKYVDRDTILKKSDIISVHVPLNDNTYKMINSDFISRMKDGAFIINTSRGKVLDEESLILALKERKLSGAGMGVMEIEPASKDNPLFKYENIVFTPHSGSLGIESFRETMDLCIENIEKILNGVESKFLLNEEYFKQQTY